MPRPFSSFPHIGSDTFSVIPDSQSKQLVAVSDFCFDSAGIGMANGFPQRLTRNPENLNVERAPKLSCVSPPRLFTNHHLVQIIPDYCGIKMKNDHEHHA